MSSEVGTGDHKSKVWFEALASALPRVIPGCSELGIVDEGSYRDHEHELSGDKRRDIGEYRFEFLIAEGRRDDPCDVARCAPPWLQSENLAKLRISIPLSLADHGILCVGDLARADLRSLRALPWMRQETSTRIASAIRDAIHEGPTSRANRRRGRRAAGEPGGCWITIGGRRIDRSVASNKVDSEATLLGALKAAISCLDARGADVLKARLQIDGDKVKLRQLAERYSLTRQGASLVEKKAFDAVRQLGSWEGRFSAAIVRFSRRSPGPAFFHELEAEDAWFAGISGSPNVMKQLLKQLPVKAHLVEVRPSVSVITTINDNAWRDVLATARAVLRQVVEKRVAWSRDECRAQVGALLERDAPNLGDVLWSAVEPDAYFAQGSAGADTLVSYGKSLGAVILAIVSEAHRPLHFGEIKRLAQERDGRPVDEKYVLNVLATRALCLGRGVYGTSKHINLTVAERSVLCSRLSEQIATAPNRQWTCAELLVRAKQLPFADRLSVYIVNVVLDEIDGMLDLGRLTWVFQDADAGAEAADRIDLRRAVEHVLVSAGCALGTEEILERLSLKRGMSGYMQIASRGRVLRLGRKKWGLIDRDSGLSDVQREACLQDVLHTLAIQSTALHVSEVYPAVLGPSNARLLRHLPRDEANWLLFGLAQNDSRFRVASGDLVYDAAWDGPRRMNVSEAVRSVVQEISESGATTEALRERVRAIVGRDVDSLLMSSAIWRSADWNAGLGLWFRSKTSEAA